MLAQLLRNVKHKRRLLTFFVRQWLKLVQCPMIYPRLSGTVGAVDSSMNKAYDKNGLAVVTAAEALAKHLEIDIDDAQIAIDQGDYLVLTDAEANSACRESILTSLWAFNADFLAAHSKVADSETFELLQTKFEDANNAIARLINNLDIFVKDAILADGRGHFLAGYDGDETEADGFFIYRN